MTDNSLADTYVITVTHTVSYKTDANNPTQTDTMELTEKITIIVEIGCDVVDLFTDTVFVDPVEYTIGEAGFNLPFEFKQTSNPDTCTLPMTYTLTDIPGRPNMLTLDSNNLRL